MGSTYTSLHYHLVFSTKERQPLICTEWRGSFHKYLGGTVGGLGGVAKSVGGIEDHVHLLVSLRATHQIADFLRELKKASCMWAIRHHSPQFSWQDGYAAFSVSAVHDEKLHHYIDTQEEHHRNVPFTEELIRLLKKHNVDYNPKYLE